MRHLILGIALIGLLAGCAHTFSQTERAMKEAGQIPSAVYQDVKQNVNTMLKHFGHTETKATQ